MQNPLHTTNFLHFHHQAKRSFRSIFRHTKPTQAKLKKGSKEKRWRMLDSSQKIKRGCKRFSDSFRYIERGSWPKRARHRFNDKVVYVTFFFFFLCRSLKGNDVALKQIKKSDCFVKSRATGPWQKVKVIQRPCLHYDYLRHDLRQVTLEKRRRSFWGEKDHVCEEEQM